MPKRLVVPFFLLLVLVALPAAPAFSRPYHGDAFTFTQPDGTRFPVRLYGDEYYAVIETPDGYTLTEDPASGFYTYAFLSPGGMSFLSSRYTPGGGLPPGLILEKHIRLAPPAVRQLSETARQKFGVDDKGQLLPALRLRMRPRDYGFHQWTPDLEAEALALETEQLALPLAPPGSATVGKRVGLVLLAMFPDRTDDVTISQAEVDAYVNDPEYSGFGNATSVFGYFNIQSDGKLQYNSIVTAYFMAAHPRSYYTDESQAYGLRAQELINEGLAVLKANGFDFTKADANDDNVLDGINIFYAGDIVNNWAKGLWPHKSNGSWSGLDGEGVSTSFLYQITNMGSSLLLGAFSHENGHMICNFPDLYPYNGNAANIGGYSLMSSSGSTHPVALDPYLKIHAGWATVVDLTSSSHLRGAVQADRNTFYRYRNPSRSQEYFLLSMRTDSGYEGPYGGATDSVNPTDGLVIWHAWESGSNTNSTIYTTDNPGTVYTIPYELMVVEANPSSTYIPWYDDPSPETDDSYHAADVSEASDSTSPALKFWDTDGRTVYSGLDIHDISIKGDEMTFIAGAGAIGSPPLIGLTATALSPSCDFGTNADPQTFAVFNSGGGTLDYTISDDCSWLNVSPSTGSATTEADQVSVIYNTAGLAAGTHTATIMVSSGVSNSPQLIPITLTVNSQPSIALNTTTLSTSLPAGAAGAESFVIDNNGGGTLHYTLSTNVPWLTLGAEEGTVCGEEDEIVVYCDASGMFEGVYTGTITVTSSDGNNSPQDIEVTLTVTGHIAVIDPDGGETVWKGNNHDIRWLTDGIITGEINIELEKNGVSVATVAVATENDGQFTWSVDPGTIAGSDYRIRIESVNEPALTGESFTDFSIAAIPALTSVPYSESFESGFGSWNQATDDYFDWTNLSGPTLSLNTGPAAAQDGAYYIYTESSSPNNPGKSAVLEAYFDLRSATVLTLSLYYHMYGVEMGSLLIEASPDQDHWTKVFSRGGNQGNWWHEAFADLTPFAGKAIVIRITGKTGSSWTSDMALDAVTIKEGSRAFSWNLFMPAILK